MNTSLAVTLVLTVIASMVPSGYAIYCYVCTSDINNTKTETMYHQNCAVGNNKGGDSNNYLGLVDCHRRTGSLYAQCSKKLNKTTGVTERDCMLPVLPDDNRCDIQSSTIIDLNGQQTVTYYGACVCSTSKCNSANGRHITSYAQIVALLAVVVRTLVW